jgi:hypothetical protein
MTDQEKSLHRDDCRRGAALVVHHARGDVDGINAILQEAAEADRVSDLFIALLDLYQTLVPELRTELAIKLLSATVTKIAGTPL